MIYIMLFFPYYYVDDYVDDGEQMPLHAHVYAIADKYQIGDLASW